MNLNNKTLLLNANEHVKLHKSQNRFAAAVKYAHGTRMNCVLPYEEQITAMGMVEKLYLRSHMN